MPTPSLLALQVLLTYPALAVQPADVHAPNRTPQHLRVAHPARQAALRGGAPWRAFVAGEGAGWRARFDEHSGLPHRAWGPGIELGLVAGAGASEVESALRSLLHDQGGLRGVPLEQLVLDRAVYLEASDHWILEFDQIVPPMAGTPSRHGGLELLEASAPQGSEPVLTRGRWSAERAVWNPADWHALAELDPAGAPVVLGGRLLAHLRHGRLVMLGVDTHPQAASVDTRPTISAWSAVEVAVDDGPLPEAAHAVEGATLVVVPVAGPGGIRYHLAWAVRTRTGPQRGDPPGIWFSLVDANSGELLGVENQVRFGEGVIYGEHDTRTVDGDMSVSSLPFLDLASELDADTTDESGAYSVEGEVLELDGLEGTYIRVNNASGDEGWTSWTDGDLMLTDEQASQAEIDSFVFLSQIRSWGEVHAPDLGIVTGRLTSNVDIASSCNAYYDGSVNFFQAGSGCNNTGRIADVAYHEWGHGLHAYAADSWYVDGAVGEGAGDVTAFLQTGDSTIGPGFFTNGQGIRDVARDRVYPDDWTGEVHEDGLIFGGAVWDLLELLRETMPEEDARFLVAELFVEALRANPSTEETYDAFIVSDDDNGDLGDGTPHTCEILEAFSRHGLGPSGSAAVLQLDTTPVGPQVGAGEDITVEASLVNLVPDCIKDVLDEAELLYSIDRGASWTSLDLDVAGTELAGVIPAQPEGTVVHYYLAARNDDADVTAPPGGERTPFSLYVGGLEPLWCNDFEVDDGGFSHQSFSGSDDWAWDSPPGIGGDPVEAASGVMVWGNDLGDGRNDGEYNNNAHNLLESPAIDTQGNSEVVVQFSRWLQVEDGYYDQARVLANDEVIWSNHATDRSIGNEHHQDEQWVTESFMVDLGDAESLTLGWELQADAGLTFGGWTIDDLCVYAPAPPPPALEDTGTDEPPEGCGGCSGAPGGPAGLLLPLLTLGLVRRRGDQ